MKKYLIVLTTVFFSNLISFAQNDCSDAIIVCGNSGYTDLEASGFGTQELSGSNTCSSQENHSIWLKIIIDKGGTLGFTLTPTTTDINEDFDFFVFGPNVNCGNIGQAIRCSTTNPLASGQSNNLTGMNGTETDTSEGPGNLGNSFVQWLTVNDGDSYFLVIDRPIGTSNFDLQWTGTATFSDQPTISVPLGTTTDLEECDADGTLDNSTSFDLSVNNFMVGTQTDVDITYHTSNNDATLGINPITNVTNFQNTSNPQTIYTRLTNQNTECFSTTTFTLTVNSGVNFNTPNNLFSCDTDNDGFTTFDLSLNDSINNDPTNNTVTYFGSENEALNNITSGILPLTYTNTVAYTNEIVWARIENITSGCFSVTSFALIVNEFPTLTKPSDILQCDDDNDGFYTFDLPTLKDSEIYNGQDTAVFEVLYFTSQADADANSNAVTSFTNTSTYNSETIFVRIHNIGNTDCYLTESFNIEVFETPTPSTAITNLTTCDSNTVGTDFDGFEEFDLTLKETEILNGQNAANFTISYFSDSALTAPITNPSAFVNTSAIQTIYVLVENSANTNCSATTSFNLEVFELPTITNSFTLKQCDEDGVSDLLTDFNLDEANEFLSNDNSNVVTYFLSYTDADTNNNPIAAWPFNNGTQSTVFARIENTNGCHRVAQVDLLVSATAFPANSLMVDAQCDDDNTIDGFREFNLTDYDSHFESLFPTGQNLEVSYYSSIDDALNADDTVKINKSVPFIIQTPYNQILYVRVESLDNGECFGVGPYLELVVNERPEFELPSEDIYYCLNLPYVEVSILNPTGIYSYEWLDSLGTIISTNSNAFITSGGIYSVYATSTDGCTSFEHTIEILESSIANLTEDDVTIIDDTTNNSITIDTSVLGIGDYEFTLDDIDGIYQDEPVFENVAPGIRTIFIRDKNDCGIFNLEVAVIGYPKFFTPNSDGYNDTWQVLGINENFYSSSKIYIFDRYGKLITQISPSGSGWDGSYNGELLPSTDYWFSVELIDKDGNSKLRKGHFSLLRH